MDFDDPLGVTTPKLAVEEDLVAEPPPASKGDSVRSLSLSFDELARDPGASPNPTLPLHTSPALHPTVVLPLNFENSLSPAVLPKLAPAPTPSYDFAVPLNFDHAPSPAALPRPTPSPTLSFDFAASLGPPATPLLAGELLILQEKMVIDVLEPSAPRACALFLTNHRILVEAHTDPTARALSVHVHAISKLRRAHVPQSLVREHAGQLLELQLDVICRVNARAALRLQATDTFINRVSDALRRLRAQCAIAQSFAAAHAAALRAAPDGGWAVYDMVAEFQRQGLLNPLSCWRVSEANRQYGLCASYPPLLVVPKSISDEALSASAAFRSSRRFPTLCWKDPQSFASISRAGQPLVGINGKRSPHDEALLAALLETNPECECLAIVDCRPRLNAEANVLNGKGYESSSNYQRTLLKFVDIPNIHVMRESMRRLLAALSARDESAGEWLRELSGCAWLEHVQAVLRGARSVVQLVLEHRSVLVHCSDGWDRTSQITSLSQLQLDPYFRTLRGFAVLVEKEWLSFGHQFALRHGSTVHAHAAADGGGAGPAIAAMPEEQQSPVFVQFIDCVWHLTLCCPRAFEFSQLFLATVLEHLFSARYGTFLLDTHQLRAHCQLPQRTRSLWSDLLDGAAEKGYVNPFYAPDSAPGVLSGVELSGCALEVFKAYYCRGPWTVDPNDGRAMAERALAERQHRR